MAPSSFQQLSLFSVVSGLFVLPGYWWVSWLHRRDGFGWTLRLTLGFVWSFALFSLLGAPFLWLGGSFAAFSRALAVLWAVFVPLSGCLWWRTRKTFVNAASREDGLPEKEREATAVAVPPMVWASLGGYILLVGMVLASWSGGNVRTQEQLLAMSPLILLVACALLFPFRTQLTPLLRISAEDNETPPRLWTALATGLIGLQAAGSAVYFRPDWDDSYYLAAVRDYEHSPSLNDREPITHDLGGVNAPHRVMCLELWGAAICRLTGTPPQALFHSLLPPLFVLASFAAYAALFSRVLPRKWIPLALIGLSGYFLWGIGGQFGAANHFLIRIWQGKAIMLHLALPLIAMLLIELAGQACLRVWLSLLAAVCCALGFSSSAIFLGAAVVSCLSLALAATMDRRRIRFLAMAAAACLPLVIEGAAILADGNIGVSATGTAISPHEQITSWQFWVRYLLFDWIRNSCVDVLWLVSLPLAALLLYEPRRLAFPVYYPLAVLCTFGNPFLSLWVADHASSRDAYYRFFWLLPVGAGWGIVVALAARLAAALLARPKNDRRPSRDKADGVERASTTLVPLAVAIASVVLLARLPGTYVWSSENRFDVFMFPSLGENLLKVPPDLIPIVGQLEADPDIERHVILCGEEVTSFLMPWSPQFRYIITRTYFLPGGGLDPALREPTERLFLNMVAHNGKFAETAYRARLRIGHQQPIPAAVLDGTVPVPLPPIAGLPRLDEVPELLDRYHVEYIITSPPLWISGRNRDSLAAMLLAQRDALFRELGFTEVHSGPEHSLWRRSASAATGTGPTLTLP